jgi:hypothetical protein
MLRRCSRCGVPQACPTLKKYGCNDYASEEQWSNRLKRRQPSQHRPKRSGDRGRRHPQLELNMCIAVVLLNVILSVF